LKINELDKQNQLISMPVCEKNVVKNFVIDKKRVFLPLIVFVNPDKKLKI